MWREGVARGCEVIGCRHEEAPSSSCVPVWALASALVSSMELS